MLHYQSPNSSPAKLVFKLPKSSPLAGAVMLAIQDRALLADDVAAILGKDLTMSSILLKLANVSLPAGQAEVMSIRRAVRVVGPEPLGRSVTVAGVWRTLDSRSESALMKTIWKHSLATAIISGQLACEAAIGDPAYTLGLLHSMGQIGLVHENASLYDSVMQRARSEGRELAVLERQEFGFDSRMVCSNILSEWNLKRMKYEFETSERLEQACMAAHAMGYGGCQAHQSCRLERQVSPQTEKILSSNQTAASVHQQIRSLEWAFAGGLGLC